MESYPEDEINNLCNHFISVLQDRDPKLLIERLEETVRQRHIKSIIPDLVNNDEKSVIETMEEIIANLHQHEEKTSDWKKSVFRKLPGLQSNNAGKAGEEFIQKLCERCDISSNIDGTKTKKNGGGIGDGTILNETVEIKLAHLGCDKSSFQHELGEKPWLANVLMFIDISPDNSIFLSIMKNAKEELYKANGAKWDPYFPTRSFCWRKKSGAFKFDTTVKINTTSVTMGHAIKITQETSFQTIKSFICKSFEKIKYII